MNLGHFVARKSLRQSFQKTFFAETGPTTTSRTAGVHLRERLVRVRARIRLSREGRSRNTQLDKAAEEILNKHHGSQAPKMQGHVGTVRIGRNFGAITEQWNSVPYAADKRAAIKARHDASNK